MLTAVLNVAAFDFFFVPPRFTFAVSDAQYLVTFGVMLTVALVIANLMASVRQQTRVAGARERRTALLYAMSRELAATRGISSMARVAVRHVAEVFQCQAVVLLPDADGKLRYPREPPLDSSFRGADLAVAQWVADHGRRAGLGTDTLPAAPALYVPLRRRAARLGRAGGAAVESAAGAAAGAAATCSRRSPGRSVLRWSARGLPRRPKRREWPPKVRVCATRCWRPSRTTCARRSR